MIDSHAHLAMFPDAERDSVLARAAQAGVGMVLVPATGPQDLESVAEMGARWPGRVVVAVGVHPHEAHHLGSDLKRRVEKALTATGVVALGEIGLDSHYDFSTLDEQKDALRWQLGLARETGLPVIFHHREAWDDFLAMLDEFPGLRGVAHSFTEGAAGATEMARRGLLIGISGMVTFPKGENIRQAAAAVAAGSFLLETDSPYLAPVPHRGKRNEPALVRLVAETVARVRGIDLDEVERDTDANFRALFKTTSRPPVGG